MSKLNPYAVVYVDDEALALKYFEKGFAQDFNVYTASNAAEGLAIIQKHHAQIGVLMSDQRMPGQTGVELLEQVRRAYPQIVRILVTAYTDIDSAIAGVNEGAIYRYVSKPWDAADLRINLLRALEFYTVLRERDQLVREKLSVLQQIVLSDATKNLGVLAAGLGCHFRHALRAASQFIAALPEEHSEADGPEMSRAAFGSNLENLIKKASHHIFHVSSAMRDVAGEAGCAAPEPCPLAALLGDAKLLSKAGPIELKIDPALPPLRAHPKQIAKLFALLVSNLRALHPDESPVRIEARETTDAGAKVLHVLFSDNGPDWTSEQRARFFAPFSSTKDGSGSLGLDLAVCFFIVHHHGGRITVSGKAPTRVAIDLPLEPAESETSSWQQSRLDQLFQRERSWEEFLGRPE